MKKKISILWPLVSLILGLLCAAARSWQLLQGFEGNNPFAIPGNAPTIVLSLLYLIAAAALLLLSVRMTLSPRIARHPELTVYATENRLIKAAMVIAAFLCLVGVTMLWDGMRLWKVYLTAKKNSLYLPGGNTGILQMITAVTTLLAFLGLLSVAKAMFRGTRAGRRGLAPPILNCCLWLMTYYRGMAPDPERWNYAPTLFAICFGAWFYLDWLGLWMKPAHPRRTLWTAGMTVVCSFAAMPGAGSAANLALLASQAVAAFALLLVAPQNLISPPEHSALTDEKSEDESHE